MGYMHIDNLYKAQAILAFKECYAMEKIHGTSAHIGWKEGQVHFFSGGEKHDRFVGLFDKDKLAAIFTTKFPDMLDTVIVFGEAYGGKQQGMSPTYGPDLKFVAFDVKINDTWLTVPMAAAFVAELDLEFVDYAQIPTDLGAINAERDKPSTQAVRNGITEPKIREGVVLRPLFECIDNRGNRIITKHKREEFAERGRPNVELDPTKLEKLAGAEAIAREWVTPMRLEHVIDTVISQREDKIIDISDTGEIIKAMLEDVIRESAGEIEDSKPARKAIGNHTVHMFKKHLMAAMMGDNI